MKKLMILLSLLMFLASQSFTQNTVLHWYLPSLSNAFLDNMARYDVIIIDPEVKFNSSDDLDYIISKNPDIKILCYLNPMEYFTPMYLDKPWSIKTLQELQKNSSWWLKQDNGEPIVFWTGADGREAQVINMSTDCPEVNGQKYYQFIVHKILKEILSDKRFSGVLIDNVWSKISWLGDYNNNHGINLFGPNVDLHWHDGYREFIKIIRQEKGKNFIVITNPGNLDFMDLTDGKMFENFPIVDFNSQKKENWFEVMNRAQRSGSYSIFNAQANNYFFTLCSSMLLDGVYFSNKQNEPYHDYYQLKLGKAKDEMTEVSPNLFVRKFKKGTVYVQTAEKKSWIEYKNGSIRRK